MSKDRAISAALSNNLKSELFNDRLGLYSITNGNCNVCWPAMSYRDKGAADKVIDWIKQQAKPQLEQT